MKKIISAGAMALTMLAAMPVLAVEQNTTRTQNSSVKPTNTDSRAKTTETTNDMSAVQKARMLEARKKALKELVDNQKDLLVRLTGRFDALFRKIQTRRDKMAAAGINVSSIDTLIAKAKVQRKEAETLLTDVKTKQEALHKAEDPKVAAQAFVKSSKALHAKLKEIQKTFLEISSKMKELEKAAKKSEQAEKKATKTNPDSDDSEQNEGETNE